MVPGKSHGDGPPIPARTPKAYKTIAKWDIELPKGKKYLATRFLAIKGLECFSVFVVEISTGKVFESLHYLSYKDACLFSSSFNAKHKNVTW